EDRARRAGRRRLARLRPAQQGSRAGPPRPRPPGRLPDDAARFASRALGDWEAAIAAVAAMPLEHEPGAVSAYHFLTQHGVCAERVRALAGRPYQDSPRTEITGPLGLCAPHVGLPIPLEGRVAKLHATDGTDASGIQRIRAMDGFPLHRLVVPGG